MRRKLWGSILIAVAMLGVTGCSIKDISVNGKLYARKSTVDTAMDAKDYSASIKKNASIYKKYVTLPQYQGLKVTVDRSLLEVTDDDVDNQINSLLRENEQTVVQQNETDQVGAGIDGTAIHGTDQIRAEQADQIKAEEPEEELTDQWVLDHESEFDVELNNVDDLRNYVRTNLETNAEISFNSNKFEMILENITDNMDPSNYPEEELESITGRLKENIQSEYESYKESGEISDFDTYLSSEYGFTSKDAFEEYIDAYASNYLLQKMVITLIADEQNISVSADEIITFGNEMASYYGYVDYDDLLQSTGNEMNAIVGYQVLSQKVEEYLINCTKDT